MSEYITPGNDDILARIDEASNRTGLPWVSVPRTDGLVGKAHIGFLPLHLRYVHNLLAEVLDELDDARTTYASARMNFRVSQADLFDAGFPHSLATDSDRRFFQSKLYLDWQEENEAKYYYERAKLAVHTVRDALIFGMYTHMPLEQYQDFIICCNWLVIETGRNDLSSRNSRHSLSPSEMVLGKLRIPKGEMGWP